MKKLISLNLLLPITIISILSGCGSVSSPAQPAFSPIQPDPTSTPTVFAGSAPGRTPTSVISDQVAVSNYTHPTKRFSINYPENWQFFEQARGVVFVEPGDQAGYSVLFNDAKEVYSKEELNQYLATFIAQNFAPEEPGFKVISREQKAGGPIVIQFASVDPKLGPVINEVWVWQQDTIVFTLFITANENQWQISQAKLQDLANTLILLDTSPSVDITPTGEPPVWVLIGPTLNEFAFFYPSDWEISRQEKRLVAVAMPDNEASFEGSAFDWPNAQDNPAGAAEQAALAYLESLSQEHKDLQNLPPTEFPLDTATGATIDFLYITKDGLQMAGSVITAAGKDKIYRVVFTSPAEFYETGLEWFNPMYKSFKILMPEGTVFEVE